MAENHERLWSKILFIKFRKMLGISFKKSRGRNNPVIFSLKVLNPSKFVA